VNSCWGVSVAVASSSMNKGVLAALERTQQSESGGGFSKVTQEGKGEGRIVPEASNLYFILACVNLEAKP